MPLRLSAGSRSQDKPSSPPRPDLPFCLLWRQPARSCKTGKATEERLAGLSTCRCAAASSWKSPQRSKLSGLFFYFFFFFLAQQGGWSFWDSGFPRGAKLHPFPSPRGSSFPVLRLRHPGLRGRAQTGNATGLANGVMRPGTPPRGGRTGGVGGKAARAGRQRLAPGAPPALREAAPDGRERPGPAGEGGAPRPGGGRRPLLAAPRGLQRGQV